MQIKEKLLQFIWQHQYFAKTDLHCLNDDPLTIVYPGIWNSDQGPDFLEGKIKVGNTSWAGHIEIHIKSSDWNRHKHTEDANYANVMLHVVWENDMDLGLPFPTLELKGKVSRIMLARYESLMNSKSFIPCGTQIATVKPIIFNAWKERLLIERLVAKSSSFKNDISQSGYDWEDGFWQAIATGFGTPKNTEAFTGIAKTVPIKILAKHANQLQQLEAILLGQAGLLDADFDEQYPVMLQKEYRFLKQKYTLPTASISLQFLRMRPAGFPTIRLAQLAALLHNRTQLFSEIKEAKTIQDIYTILDATANDYWLYHYVFEKETTFKEKKLGRQMMNVIITNAIIPYLYVYASYHKDKVQQQKLLDWLQKIAAEKNNITTGFQDLGIENKNAWDSQALIQLKKNYCDSKNCLNCAVGVSLLRKVE